MDQITCSFYVIVWYGMEIEFHAIIATGVAF